MEAGKRALRRLDLYENMIGVGDISCEEMNNIESQLNKALDKIKLERARRVHNEEIT